jgi:light-regulated signal transduction histidine kinase (bacteriophytochrome)
MKAALQIPIVFALASEPVATGYVARLALPGGSATGLSLELPDLGGKAPRICARSRPFTEVVYLASLLGSGKRRGNLIDDLLAFSRIGRTESRTTTVNLQQVVKEAVSEIESRTKGQDISWKIGTLPVWNGDRSLLKLVVVNLLSNAVKFSGTRRPAKIEIGAVEGNGDKLEIFVRDNGVGFDMQYVNKLFGYFNGRIGSRV